MNKLILLIAILISMLIFSCQKLKSGVVEGRSQSVYTSEPYMGEARITYKRDKIVAVHFQIIDTLNNEVFGSDYEKHYPTNEEYRQQCRNDWQGVLNYPKQLLEKQDLSKVDGVSGATWSYNLFKASVEKALLK